MRILKWGLYLFPVLLLLGFLYARPLLKVGTGYAAKMACSCHYIQGRSLEDVQAADLNFSALTLMNLEHLEEEKIVQASFFGLISQRAQYVPGRGCILVVDDDQPLPPPLREPAMQLASKPLPLYDTLPPGLDMALLQTAVDTAFQALPGGGTRGVVILYDGHLIHEQYADGFTADTPLLGWSMTKSITNALVGLMVKDGQLKVEEDQLFTEWANDERSSITLADLLHMNSGLEWNEEYGGVSDATQMLYREANMTDYALSKPLAYAPNTHWVYSSGTTNLLTRLIRERFNDDEAYIRYVRERLFLPSGMHSAQIEVDQSGTIVGSSYGWATARDWARFGQLYLDDGVVDGYRILPEGWVDYSVEVAVGSEGVYGAQVWLPDPEELTNVPADLYMFRGFQDQRIVIVPSRKCVMVRLGMNQDKTFPLNKFITEVLAALPPSGD